MDTPEHLPTPEPLTEKFLLRLTETERRYAKFIAANAGTSENSALRQLIRWGWMHRNYCLTERHRPASATGGTGSATPIPADQPLPDTDHHTGG